MKVALIFWVLISSLVFVVNAQEDGKYRFPNIAGTESWKQISSYASMAPGATSYNWQFPSGWTGSGSQPSNIAFTTIGPNSGTIFVTPQNQCGTNGNASLFVTVASCQNCRTIEVFPNPGNDYISVTPKTLNEEIIPRFEIISYFIVDLQGRIVIKSEDGVLINPHAIEVVGLPKGNYVIHCKLANGESYTKRLLIER